MTSGFAEPTMTENRRFYNQPARALRYYLLRMECSAGISEFTCSQWQALLVYMIFRTPQQRTLEVTTLWQPQVKESEGWYSSFKSQLKSRDNDLAKTTLEI